MKMRFPNWKAEMARLGATCADIGKVLGKSSEWVENRLQGKGVTPNIGSNADS